MQRSAFAERLKKQKEAEEALHRARDKFRELVAALAIRYRVHLYGVSKNNPRGDSSNELVNIMIKRHRGVFPTLNGYFSTSGTGYPDNPFLPYHDIDLSIKDYDLLDDKNKRLYHLIVEEINKIVEDLNVTYYLRPADEVGVSYTSTRRIGGTSATGPSSALLERTSDIGALVKVRKAALDMLYDRLRQLEDVRNSERLKPVPMRKNIDVHPGDLFGWTIKYLESLPYGRGYSYINVPTIRCPMNEGDLPLENWLEYRYNIGKGADFLQHNLLLSRYNITLGHLFPNLMNRVRELIARREVEALTDNEWKDIINGSLFAGRTPPGIDELFYRKMYRFISDNVMGVDTRSYELKCKNLTELLTTKFGDFSVYGDALDLKTISSLGLLSYVLKHATREVIASNKFLAKIVTKIDTLLREYGGNGLTRENIYLTIDPNDDFAHIDRELKNIHKGRPPKPPGSIYVNNPNPNDVTYTHKVDKAKRSYEDRDDKTGDVKRRLPVSLYTDDHFVAVSVEANVEIGDPMVTNQTRELGYMANYLGNTRRVYHRYFGDYIYDIDTSMYQRKHWVDNSNSGNLCAITSLLFNPIVLARMIELGIPMDTFVSEIILMSKLYINDKLYKVSKSKLREIHGYIMNRLGLTECVIVYKETYKRGSTPLEYMGVKEWSRLRRRTNRKDKKYGDYNWNHTYNFKANVPFRGKDGKVIPDIKYMEDELDPDDLAHLAHLPKDVRERREKFRAAARPINAKRQCVIDMNYKKPVVDRERLSALRTMAKDDKKRIDIILAEGHAFTVSSKEHRSHLMKELNKKHVVSVRPKYDIIELISIKNLVHGHVEDKSKLHDLLGNPLNKLNVGRKVYCEDRDDYTIMMRNYYCSMLNEEFTKEEWEAIDKKLIKLYDAKIAFLEKPWDELDRAHIEMLTEELNQIHPMFGYNEDKVNRVLSAMKCSDKTLEERNYYVAFDYETYTDGDALPYGVTFRFFKDLMRPEEVNDGLIESQLGVGGTIHNLDNDMTADEISYSMLLSMISGVCRVNSYSEKDQRYKLKLFSHNGGRFDSHILVDALTKCNGKIGDYKVDIKSEIKAGRLKYIGFDLWKEEQVPDKPTPEDDYDDYDAADDYREIDYKEYVPMKKTRKVIYSFSCVDSLLLLECRLKDIAKNFKLEGAIKGNYPYQLYGYVIKNKLPLKYTKKELLELAAGADSIVKESIEKFIAKEDMEEYDLIKMFETYCMQDTDILCKGLIKADTMYHSIQLANTKGYVYKDGADILSKRGYIVDLDLASVSKCRFLDSVTLSSFSKVITRYYVISQSSVSYTGIDHEYLSVYTGGLTYSKGVNNYVSSIMDDIVNNPYFYVDPKTDNQSVIKYLVTNHKYDIYKTKKTYDRKHPPPEVLELQEKMRTHDKACMLLLDANSLYPSAISMMADFGGFPIDEYIKFKGTDKETVNKLLSDDKIRWLGYVKVRWTEEGKKKSLSPEGLMHPIIIRTKYGNRHLRADDKECESCPMDDMNYKSVRDHTSGLYTIEIINGVYWPRTSKAFSHLCERVYEERLKYKAMGSPIETSVKKLLNSFYGVNLEKPHPEKVIFKLNNNGSIKDDEVILSDSAALQSKLGGMCDVVSYGDYDRISYIDMGSLDNYYGAVQNGVFVLGGAKYMMNTLFSKLDWDIIYTDTDSAFIYNEQYNKIKDVRVKLGTKEMPLMGKGLGQFKPDFDDKMVESMKKFFPKKYNEKGEKIRNRANVSGLVPEYGVVSIMSIFNAKKQYCNLLFGQVGDDRETHLTVKLQTAGKGVDHKALSLDDYLDVSHGVSLKQDRNQTHDTFIVKNYKVSIHSKGTKANTRTIRNQDVITKERIEKEERRKKK